MFQNITNMIYYFLSTNLLYLICIILYSIYENHKGLIAIDMHVIYVIIENNSLHNIKSYRYSSRHLNSLP